MNKEEILEKSRAENKNIDLYKLEILDKANGFSVLIMSSLALIIGAYGPSFKANGWSPIG